LSNSDNSSDAIAYYNINGQYTNLSGQYGPIDGTIGNANIIIYGDGKLLTEFTSNGGAMPKDFSVDVTGVKQLKIEISRSSGYWLSSYGYHALANLVLQE
jgi:hypothetical protein